MLPTKNRTYWPTTGGAVSFQPGWFQGHLTAFIYVNLGFGTDGPDGGPPNMSNPMVPPFQILGPSKNPYPGTVCLPQVPLPAGANVSAGDNATIQLVELAVHGAALYSVSSAMPFRGVLAGVQANTGPLQCVDITFVEPNDPRLAQVNESNCFNSNDIGFADVYTITERASGASNVTSGGEHTFFYFGRHRSSSWVSYLGWVPAVVGGLWVLL